MLKEVWSGSIEILRAMWITLKHLFRRPVTNQYPSEPVAVLQQPGRGYVVDRAPKRKSQRGMGTLAVLAEMGKVAKAAPDAPPRAVPLGLGIALSRLGHSFTPSQWAIRRASPAGSRSNVS